MTTKIYQGEESHMHSGVTCIQVNGETIFGTPPVTFPFKVGDFVRVKRNVNPSGTEEGPMARAAGKVLSVDGVNSCKVEFPGYIQGTGSSRHTRNYFLNRRSTSQVGYRPRKHEAVSCIRLIKS